MLSDIKGVWSPVQQGLDLYDDPQVIANGYLGNATAPTGAPFALPTNPVQFDERPNSITRAPQLGEHTDDVLRAAEMLYAAGAHHLILPFTADLADRMPDAHALEALARIAERHEDARAMLLIGKGALAQGFALDAYAFPTIGVPHFGAIGPEVDRSIIYSIVRQESAFDQNDLSTANAMGLMQVTPEAGRHVAGRFGVRYNQKKLRQEKELLRRAAISRVD